MKIKSLVFLLFVFSSFLSANVGRVSKVNGQKLLLVFKDKPTGRYHYVYNKSKRKVALIRIVKRKGKKALAMIVKSKQNVFKGFYVKVRNKKGSFDKSPFESKTVAKSNKNFLVYYNAGSLLQGGFGELGLEYAANRLSYGFSFMTRNKKDADQTFDYTFGEEKSFSATLFTNYFLKKSGFNNSIFLGAGVTYHKGELSYSDNLETNPGYNGSSAEYSGLALRAKVGYQYNIGLFLLRASVGAEYSSIHPEVKDSTAGFVIERKINSGITPLIEASVGVTF